MLNGQVNLRDANRRQVDFVSGGKQYKLVETPAVLLVRYAKSLSFEDRCYLHPPQTQGLAPGRDPRDG